MQFVELVDGPTDNPLYVSILQLNPKNNLLAHAHVNLGVCNGDLKAEAQVPSQGKERSQKKKGEDMQGTINTKYKYPGP